MKGLFSDLDKTAFEPFRIDCSRCCGICCTALYCYQSDGFPENKPAGKPCKNLLADYKCKIHSQLGSKHLKGCTAYDCAGAGQRVTNLLGNAPDWNRLSDAEFDGILKAFLTIMQMHQFMWHLEEALYVNASESKISKNVIKQLIREGGALLDQPFEMLQNLDYTLWKEHATQALKDASRYIAAQAALPPAVNRKKDYMGKNLKQKNLRGMDFSMSLLIAANLEQAELYGANFLGADMRDTNIRNTDLSSSLFLSQMQVNSAAGNSATKLPPQLLRPISWDN